MDRLQFLLNNDDEEKDPERFSSRLGLTNSEKNYQAGIEEPEQENYLDDSFGSFTRNLPIDQPNGSIVSGGREDLYHKYSQMLEQRPESERVLEDFMGRRPTFANYNPSGGDKLNAAAFGIAGALNKGPEYGIERAQQKRNEPFERSVQDYNSEGRYVNEYAKLADSSRNRAMTSLLSQMRMQEQERVNRAREANYKSLDQDRKQRRIDAQSDDNYRAEQDRLSRGERDRNFNATERHRRNVEGRLSKSDDEKLSPFEKSGMRTYERALDKGTILDSLGFGAPEEESYPEQLINPITGQPYTKYEIENVLGKSSKYKGGLFNKPQEF